MLCPAIRICHWNSAWNVKLGNWLFKWPAYGGQAALHIVPRGPDHSWFSVILRPVADTHVCFFNLKMCHKDFTSHLACYWLPSWNRCGSFTHHVEGRVHFLGMWIERGVVLNGVLPRAMKIVSHQVYPVKRPGDTIEPQLNLRRVELCKELRERFREETWSVGNIINT